MRTIDPGCVKTHTSAKYRKYNSPGRHHASRVQYDLTLRYAIPSRSFHARSKGWSFYTAKTLFRHGPVGKGVLFCGTSPILAIISMCIYNRAQHDPAFVRPII